MPLPPKYESTLKSICEVLAEFVKEETMSKAAALGAEFIIRNELDHLRHEIEEERREE